MLLSQIRPYNIQKMAKSYHMYKSIQTLLLISYSKVHPLFDTSIELHTHKHLIIYLDL